jgi:hypothetical protein
MRLTLLFVFICYVYLGSFPDLLLVVRIRRSDQVRGREREGCVVCVVSYVIAFVGEVPFPQTRGTRRVSKGVKGEGFRYVCKCVSV